VIRPSHTGFQDRVHHLDRVSAVTLVLPPVSTHRHHSPPTHIASITLSYPLSSHPHQAPLSRTNKSRSRLEDHARIHTHPSLPHDRCYNPSPILPCVSPPHCMRWPSPTSMPLLIPATASRRWSRHTPQAAHEPVPCPLPVFLPSAHHHMPIVNPPSRILPLRIASVAPHRGPAARSRQVREDPKRSTPRSGPAVRDFQPPSTCR
jgi:hypothetical protein